MKNRLQVSKPQVQFTSILLSQCIWNLAW